MLVSEVEMLSHEKTYLTQRLGFADPDKKDSKHDLACQFLARETSALSSWLTGSQDDKAYSILEYPHSKGEGQYKTTLGFFDVLIWWPRLSFAVVEVKISKIPLGDVLRQIMFYRSFPIIYPILKGSMYIAKHWVLATAYDLTDIDVETLTRADVKWLKLGEKFEEFCRAQEKTAIAGFQL